MVVPWLAPSRPLGIIAMVALVWEGGREGDGLSMANLEKEGRARGRLWWMGALLDYDSYSQSGLASRERRGTATSVQEASRERAGRAS